MHSEDASRRLHPRMIDTDWLLLRALRPAIERLAGRVAAPGRTAIDFGCGSQPYRAVFEKRGTVYIGADFAGGDIPIDRNGRVGVADASADLVLSFQVLEHVRDLGRYFAEAQRVLRDDGWLLLSTHGSWFYHPHPEDHRRWTREGLLAELASHGFETRECIPVLGPLAYTTLLRLTMGFHTFLKVPLIGRALAIVLAVCMNARGWLENLITPASVTRDNACVYVTLSRPVGRPA